MKLYAQFSIYKPSHKWRISMCTIYQKVDDVVVSVDEVDEARRELIIEGYHVGPYTLIALEEPVNGIA